MAVILPGLKSHFAFVGSPAQTLASGVNYDLTFDSFDTDSLAFWQTDTNSSGDTHLLPQVSGVAVIAALVNVDVPFRGLIDFDSTGGDAIFSAEQLIQQAQSGNPTFHVYEATMVVQIDLSGGGLGFKLSVHQQPDTGVNQNVLGARMTAEYLSKPKALNVIY